METKHAFERSNDALRRGRLNRRDFNRRLASVGLTTVLLPLAPRRASAQREHPIVFTRRGYEVPKLHQEYIAKYGASPEFVLWGDEHEAVAKLKAGFQPDVAHPCISNVLRWRDEGLLKPIDTNRLKYWPHLWPDLKNIEGMQFQGQEWFVPFDWGNASVLYRADLLDIEEESWTTLYDERYKEQLAVFDSAEAAVAVAALVLGYENVFSLSKEQRRQVSELMLKQKELLRFYWKSPAEVEKALAEGEIVAAYAWNASAMRLKKQGVPVKYMNPKEGIFTWVCGLVLFRDAPASEQAAYDFVDSMLSPTAGKFLIENYAFGHSNKKAFELVESAQLEGLGLLEPQAILSHSIFLREVTPEYANEYSELYAYVRTGPPVCSSQICQTSCGGRCQYCDQCRE